MKPEMGLSRRERAALQRQADDLATVLATNEGRRLIRGLLEQTGVFSPVRNMEEAAVRNIGLSLIERMDALAPTVFPRLMMDAANERVRTDVEERNTGQASFGLDGETDEE